MKRTMITIILATFSFFSCENNDFNYDSVSLPVSVGTDIFSGNTYDRVGNNKYLAQYVFHTDNTFDCYYYHIKNNEKTLSSQSHYEYSYNADKQLLYVLPQDEGSVYKGNVYISDNEMYKDLEKKSLQTLIPVYFCTANDDEVVVSTYFAGDINKTQAVFTCNDSDTRFYLSWSNFSGRNWNLKKPFEGVPFFADDGTMTIREYKDRTIILEKGNRYTYSIYTTNVIKGTYSFPTVGTDVTGTITFTEIPEAVEISLKANTPYTFSQVPTTYTLTKHTD